MTRSGAWWNSAMAALNPVQAAISLTARMSRPRSAMKATISRKRMMAWIPMVMRATLLERQILVGRHMAHQPTMAVRNRPMGERNPAVARPLANSMNTDRIKVMIGILKPVKTTSKKRVW